MPRYVIGSKVQVIVAPNAFVMQHKHTATNIVALVHLSHGVLSGPFPRSFFILCSVGLVDVRNFRHEWVIRVRVCEQGADRQQDLYKRRLRNRYGTSDQNDKQHGCQCKSSV